METTAAEEEDEEVGKASNVDVTGLSSAALSGSS